MALINRSIFCVEVRMKPIASGRFLADGKLGLLADEAGMVAGHLVEHVGNGLAGGVQLGREAHHVDKGERRSCETI